jgi:tetratricopeptide (TPR) repeat protein
MEQGRLEAAQHLCEQALAIHREAGDRRREGNVLGNLGILHLHQRRPEKSRQILEQALAIFREVDNRRAEGSMLSNLGAVCMELGLPVEARRLYEQALAIHREVGNRRGEGMTLGNLVWVARLTVGDAATAMHWSDQAEVHFTAVGDKASLSELLCGRAHIELAEGRSGRGFLERAQDLAESAGAGPEGWLGSSISSLQRACEAFEAGEHHRLFRGELIEDIPEGRRRWLQQTGQLATPP